MLKGVFFVMKKNLNYLKIQNNIIQYILKTDYYAEAENYSVERLQYGMGKYLWHF